MKHRVREATFDLLGPAIKRKHAIDLFAGSGALALEALSRGATSATFIERHIPTAQLIRENLRALRIEDRGDVLTTSTFLWVERLARGPALPSVESHSVPTDDSAGPRLAEAGKPIRGPALPSAGSHFLLLPTDDRAGPRITTSDPSKDLPPSAWAVFCSPPYDFYVDRHAEMIHLLERLIAQAPAGTIVVVEADNRLDFADLSHIGPWDVRSYPPAHLGIMNV
jgi:16S rRNA G966 N2-methylase RsmD